MTPLAALGKLYREDATAVGIHGGRVSENSAPQNTPFPRVVMEATDRSRAMSHGGNGGTSGRQLLSVRFQLQARTKGEAEAMRERLSALLDGFRGSLTGTNVTVMGAFEKSAPDEFDVAVNDGETGAFAVAAQYDVHFFRPA